MTRESSPSIEFVHSALPPPPARVLEVGAGDGELAAALASVGYDVLAVDPEPGAEHVRPVPLHKLREPLHEHLHPLDQIRDELAPYFPLTAPERRPTSTAGTCPRVRSRSSSA